MRPTRRQILATSAAAMAAKAEVRLPRKVRLGIVGLEGHLGDVLKPLPQLPDVEVVGIAHPDPALARRTVTSNARLTQAQYFNDWRRMLDEAQLDMAAVCTPNGPRAEAILACLDRKLHVMAEKPLALTRQDLNRIRAAATDAKVKVGTILPMRFTPAYMALRQIVSSGEIGQVINITSQKSYKAGNRPDWMKRMSTYGGTIPWIGIHMIDLMRFTSGRELTEAYSYRAQVEAPAGIGEMENTTGSIFRMDNGGVATLHMDYCRPDSAVTHGDDRLRLAGIKGVAEYMAATGVTLLAEGRKAEVIRELPEAKLVFLDFVEHVYNGKPTELPFDDIYRANLITIAAQEATLKGAPVRV